MTNDSLAQVACSNVAQEQAILLRRRDPIWHHHRPGEGDRWLRMEAAPGMAHACRSGRRKHYSVLFPCSFTDLMPGMQIPAKSSCVDYWRSDLTCGEDRLFNLSMSGSAFLWSQSHRSHSWASVPRFNCPTDSSFWAEFRPAYQPSRYFKETGPGRFSPFPEKSASLFQRNPVRRRHKNQQF
jgi:hypothetical protein